MSGTDKTAAKNQNDVEINNPQSRHALHQPKLIEDDRDNDRDEQLKEALDPEVDDPEAPGIGDGVMGRSIEKQSRQVEDRDRRSGDQEESDQTAPLRIAPSRRHGSPQQGEPVDEADGEQYLPKTADLEIFPALVAEPEPGVAQPLKEPGPLAEQAPDNDHQERGEQQVTGAALPGGLAAAEHARDEQSAADISGSDPQDRELQMPGAQQVAGQ